MKKHCANFTTISKISLLIVVFFTLGTKVFAAADNIDSLMAKMSLRDKVGQLFILEYTEGIEKLVRRDRIGGIILMESGIDDYGDKINRLQSISRIPMFLSIDGEWGASMRFDTLSQFPRNMQMGALSSPELVYEAGAAMAKQFARLGIDINYAPSVDINNNPLNPAIGPRSFGDDREKVAEYGAALMHGMQDNGILTSAKHFPGHGDTDTDSHKALPLLPFDRNRLDSLELFPFRKLIEEGVAMVMVGHLNVPALDSTGMPSSISYPIITKLLKEKMGFDGIVITDALAMKGVAEYVPSETVALESFKAGSDILLMPPVDRHKSIRNVLKAVRRGEISRERLDESVRKILTMKQNLGILGHKPHISSENIYREVETAEVLETIQRLSDESVTMIKRPEANLPEMLSSGHADTLSLDKRMSREKLDSTMKALSGKEYVVLMVPQFRAQKNDKELFSTISPDEIYSFVSEWAATLEMTLVIMDTPYILDKIDQSRFDGIYIGYSPTPANKKAVWKVISGEIPAKGVLPVSAGGHPTGFHAE